MNRLLLSSLMGLAVGVGPLAALDFSLSSGGDRSVTPGSTVTNTVEAALLLGATEPVTFAASGLPVGARATFLPSSCAPPCSAILRIRTAGLTRLGVYPVTVTGTWPSGTRTTTFSLAVTRTSDHRPPTVSLTAPLASATVRGTALLVSATASDNVAVAGVQFLLNGANLGGEDVTSPYAATFDTTASPDGPHALQARARDAGGNVALSAVLNVTVDNGPPTGSVLVAGGAAATNSRSASLTLAASDALGSVTQMRFSNTGTTYSAAEAYAPTKTWTLANGAGTKTVFAQFKDAAGNWSAAASDTIVYDVAAPTISGVATSNLTATSATLHWTTSEPATSQVEYGPTTAYGALTTLDPMLRTAHSVVLSGLAPLTTYHYRVRSRDAAGNERNSPRRTLRTVSSEPSGEFQSETLVSGLDLPTAVKFLPGGEMLVLELGGTIRRVDPNTWQVHPVPFLALSNIGTTNGQQGLMDLAFDPDFESNHYYYVFYTLGSPNRDRVSRFTVNEEHTGTVPGSELVIYQDPEDANAEHHGGALNFGNDGKLYVTTGEHFRPEDAQSLLYPRGKILRFNPDGTVPEDNPFHDGAGPNYDAIWALGLRNPFRASYDPPTGRLYIGDVGGNVYSTAFEEVHVGAAGANYGWPACEGFSCGANPAYTSPLYAYPHNGRDASVTGGFVYRGTQFPAAYHGAYFYADYAQNWIKGLHLDDSGNVTGTFDFEPPDGSPDGPYGDIVHLSEGPDGALYYVDLGYSDETGETGISKIRRIRFVSSNRPPTVAASADPTSGLAPLAVSFSSAGTSDPEGDALTYLWTFGDGSESTAAHPQHTFTNRGRYAARLAVSDGSHTSLSAPLTIDVGVKPVPRILTPDDGFLFRAGDTVFFSGEATDAEDGPLGAGAFTWNIDFLHEGHVHPALPQTGVTAGSFDIPTSGHDFGGNTRYRITLTVTDSDGLQASQAIVVRPEKVNLLFDSVPPGLHLSVDGLPFTTPFVHDTAINFTHTIEAPNQVLGLNLHTFASWSDGGAQQHTIVASSVPEPYVATYTVSPIPLPSGLVAGYRFAEGTGTTTADLSGNDNHGTLANGPGWTTGRYGSGLLFDGTDYVDLGNPASLQLTGSMTLTAWIKIGTNPWDDGAIVAKLGSAGWQLKTSPDTGARTAAIQISSDGSDAIQRNGATVLAPDTWYHLAGVYDAAARTLSLYVNGVSDDGSLTGTVPASQYDAPLSVNIAQRTGIPGTFNFDGVIDEVHIFNRALTAAEVMVDMTTAR